MMETQGPWVLFVTYEKLDKYSISFISFRVVAVDPSFLPERAVGDTIFKNNF